MKSYLMAILMGLLFPASLWALSLDNLEDDEEEQLEGVAPAAVEWSGIMDFKLVNAGKTRNWADHTGDYGGKGLTRYSSVTGKNRGTNFHLGMIGLVADIHAEDKHVGHVQMNFSDHRSAKNAPWGELGLAEAYVREEVSATEIKVGFLIPPLSLEHPGVAWSTKYTITPSAINSWAGEEVRSLGVEIHSKLSTNVDFLLASFSHNDAIATVLTYRGWALHDYQGTYGTRLRWNHVPDHIDNTDGWVEPFKELDDRVGFYMKLGLHTQDHASRLDFFYYNNLAHPARFDGSNYAWTTSFGNISLAHRFGSGVEILAQTLQGTTFMGPVDVVKADFSASYGMVSYRPGATRYSLRIDDFKVEDTDGFVFPDGVIDHNDSKGQAATVAVLHHLSDQRMIGLEAVAVRSERIGNEALPGADKDPDDDLYQLVYRLTF
ncbi:MAG: hypothetical protein OXT67_01145 [Zetaproteobacteria bacterium]|nr:hypothetical protein [Zetaproteobacteria bacterium]